MINECFIQYECGNYPNFISNAINLLFGMLTFVLESENINSKFIYFKIINYRNNLFFSAALTSFLAPSALGRHRHRPAQLAWTGTSLSPVRIDSLMVCAGV